MNLPRLNSLNPNDKMKPATFYKKEMGPVFCGNKDEDVLRFLDYVGQIQITKAAPSSIEGCALKRAGKRDYSGFKMQLDAEYTKEDVHQVVAFSNTYKSLLEDDKRLYENDFYILCNLKKENGDFVFSAKNVDLERKLIISDVDRELITSLLDIKYSNPYAQMFINEATKAFVNGEISRCQLKQFIYAINLKTDNTDVEPKCKPEEFFIDIDGYGKDQKWAEYMASSANAAAFRIKSGENFNNVLREIADDASYFNFNNIKKASDIEKAIGTGKLRIYSKGLLFSKTPFKPKDSKYSTYAKKFIQNAKIKNGDDSILYFAPKVPKNFTGIEPTVVRWGTKENLGELIHKTQGILPTLVHCADIYDSLCEKFLNQDIKEDDKKEINNKIATIHWLLAQAMPYERGSDAIVNTFIKGLYSALGFETYPPKSGISFDLEAFSCELDDYVEKYTDLYSKKPKYIF